MADPQSANLMEILLENRAHARHIAKSRMRLLYLNVGAVVGVVSGAQVNVLRGSALLKDLVLLFAIALSLYSFLAFQKQTFEFKNHMTAARWAGTELGLLQFDSDEDGSSLTGIENVSEAYMGVSLPIPLGTSSTLFSALPALVTATVTGLASYYLSDPLRLPVPDFLEWPRFVIALLMGGIMLVGLLVYGKCIASRWKAVREGRRPSPVSEEELQ